MANTADPKIPPQRFSHELKKKSDPTPWLQVGGSGCVSVEHPFIAKNVPKALEMIGGSKAVSEIVHVSPRTSTLALSLNLEDRATRPIKSENVRTGNILLKIVTPKRTGRKRKRGTNGPWESVNDNLTKVPNCQDLLKDLRSNESKYVVEPVGMIDHTHRFHDLSDFQMSTQESKFMKKIETCLMSMDYKKIKQFNLLDESNPNEPTRLFAPPVLTHLHMPFNYGYQQNPAVQPVVDIHGNTLLTNRQRPERLCNYRLAYNAEIPTAAHPGAPPLANQDNEIQTAVSKLRAIFAERPIWTRRALVNTAGIKDYGLKNAIQYLGYMFSSGPWRDAIIKLGVDPRLDPRFHIYQTLSFQIFDEDAANEQAVGDGKPTPAKKVRNNQESSNTSHLFDGKILHSDGKVWQVCDITDPLLKELLGTKDLRSECDIRSDGWYNNGRWAKVKTIMKTKINSLKAGEIAPDTDFAPILELEDVMQAQGTGTRSRAARGDPDVAIAAEVRARAINNLSSKRALVKDVEAMGRGKRSRSDNDEATQSPLPTNLAGPVDTPSPAIGGQFDGGDDDFSESEGEDSNRSDF